MLVTNRTKESARRAQRLPGVHNSRPTFHTPAQCLPAVAAGVWMQINEGTL